MSNSWIGKTARQAIYARDNLTCCYCGEVCTTGHATTNGMTLAQKKKIATLDHIVPQYEIAQTCTSDQEFFEKRKDPKNLVVVCVACNSSKQHTPLYIWANKKGFDYAKLLEEIARRINTAI